MFEKNTANFVGWLRAKGATISPKVEVADLRSAGQGRALVAADDIAEDEDLFTLPRLVLLTARNCSLVRDHPETEDKLLDLDQWAALVVVLAYEWKVKRTESDWWPYFEVLPVNDAENYTMDQLMFWSDEEVAQLEPSLVVGRIGRDSADKMYQAISSRASEFFLGGISKEDFNLIATVIMSYSFDVQNKIPDDDSDDEEEEEGETIRDSLYLKSMVPLADTLNADTNKHNASLVYTADSLVMRSIKAIEKGQQIYNTYSDHPNGEILRRYGYVEQQGSAHDFGEIPLATLTSYFAENSSLSAETVDEVLNVLREIEEEDGEKFVLDSFDFFASGEVLFEFTFLVQFFTIVAAINDHKSFNSSSVQVKARGVRRVFKKCYQLLESEKISNSFLEHYTNIIKARLKRYPKRASKDFPADSAQLSRKNMANTVLISEYKSLSRCLDTDAVFKSGETTYGVVADDKLLRNIMKKEVFEGSDSQPTKKQKIN